MLMKKLMKVAIPEWQGRVSPVFDVARHLKIFEIEDGQARFSGEWDCESVDPSRRATRLAETGTTVLVCGAISRPQEMAVTAAGIQVIAQICGNVDDVAGAFAKGQLPAKPFFMPGCGGGQRRRCRRHGSWNF